MKQLLGLIGLLILFGFTGIDNSITKEERKSAISYFKQTQQDFINEVKGLSEAQLNWKPADSVWSVANVLNILLFLKRICLTGVWVH